MRLGSGGITLVRKVQPVYPAVMQSARVSGQAQLDAIIHADGTIGDVHVLRSTNGVFAQSAIDAVKQWKLGHGYRLVPSLGFLFAGAVGLLLDFTGLKSALYAFYPAIK